MDVRSVHHVAFAVEDLDAAVETYRSLFGAEVEVRDRLEAQGVEAAYLRLGTGRIELVAPLGEDTYVGRFLASRGPGMHHVGIAVGDVAAALEELAARGAEVIDPQPRPGLGGHLAFEGGQSVGANVSQEIADGLAAALAASEAVFELPTEDGTYLLSLGKVVYVRRSERETQIGFAATA